MEISVKCICMIMGLLVAIYGSAHADNKPCPNSSPEKEAQKLGPCLNAVYDGNAKVSTSCCYVVKQMLKTPACMCAVVLSDFAKKADVKPEIALTIPKRCEIADRPVGSKCGVYTVP